MKKLSDKQWFITLPIVYNSCCPNRHYSPMAAYLDEGHLGRCNNVNRPQWDAVRIGDNMETCLCNINNCPIKIDIENT